MRLHTSPAAIKRNTTTAAGVSSCDAPQSRRPVKRGASSAPLDLNFQEAFRHLVVSPAEKTPTPAASCAVAFIAVPFYLLQGKLNKTFEKQSKKKTVRGSTSQPRVLILNPALPPSPAPHLPASLHSSLQLLAPLVSSRQKELKGKKREKRKSWDSRTAAPCLPD